MPGVCTPRPLSIRFAGRHRAVNVHPQLFARQLPLICKPPAGHVDVGCRCRGLKHNLEQKMNKSKFVLGIVIALLGGSMVLDSIISGTFYFTRKLYQDYQTMNIELHVPQAPRKTSFFCAKAGQTLSLWLRYATTRQIENKNLKLTAFLIDDDENIVWKVEENLQFGHIRKSARKVRYYKFGNYRVGKAFRGYLRYAFDGTWPPVKTSALILRKSPPVRLPLKQICFFIAGIFVCIVGIETMAKNLKMQKTSI